MSTSWPCATPVFDWGRAMKRTAIGTVAALASMAVLTIAMVPLRSHLSIATTALVLVVPVVIGVVCGGVMAGALSVGAGVLVYDWDFIPPLPTLWVGAPQNLAPPRGYVAVLLPLAPAVAPVNAARGPARARAPAAVRQPDRAGRRARSVAGGGATGQGDRRNGAAGQDAGRRGLP